MANGDSGAGGHDASTGSDGGRPPPTDGGAGTDGGPRDAGPAPPPPPPTWDGGFSGPLACAAPGDYATNWANTCGTQRWDVKTGTDSAATSVSLLPTLTTIAALTTIPMPASLPTARLAPTETTTWALKDVTLTFARLEDDSDYHLVLSDGTTTMITEVPYPGCFTGGPWACPISRARASVEKTIGLSELVLDEGHDHSYTVSVIGVGFWDPEHGQFGVAPNNLELHAILAICFGAGCDPTMD